MAKAASVKHVLQILIGLGIGVLPASPVIAADDDQSAGLQRFGDWEVICPPADKAATCLAVQRQATKAQEGGLQRLIAMELMLVPDGAVGTLLTPFGVDLAAGVVLTLNKAGPALPFKTCLATGCVVPVQFGPAALQALRGGSVLTVTFATAADGRKVDLPISLTGLGQALDRASSLRSGREHTKSRK